MWKAYLFPATAARKYSGKDNMEENTGLTLVNKYL